jgi:hypothetical protein
VVLFYLAVIGAYLLGRLQQGRYWRNRALFSYFGEFTQSQLRQMRLGFAPERVAVVRSNKTGDEETRIVRVELHHVLGRGGEDPHNPLNLREVWPWEHDIVDPVRHAGYTFVRWEN